MLPSAMVSRQSDRSSIAFESIIPPCCTSQGWTSMPEPLSIGSAPPMLATDDGLHRRLGSMLVPVESVSVSCSQCNDDDVCVVKSNQSELRCGRGHHSVFVECKKCGAGFQRPEGEDKVLSLCPVCGQTSKTRGSTAWLFRVRQSTLASAPKSPGRVALEAFTHVVRGIELAAAGGTRIPNGSECLIGFGDSGMKVAAEAEPASGDDIPYAHVQALEATGTTTRRSAGLIGGGFSLTGAAEGMLAATVINSLTTRRRINTILRIATISAEYLFVSDSIDSDRLRMFLIPIQPRIRAAQATAPSLVMSPPPASSSVADELTKLARLRDEGVLSEAEFTAAKTRLLAGL